MRLFADLTWVAAAFKSLSSKRGQGFSGPRRISDEAIDAYLDRRRIVRFELREEFAALIDAMDGAWMKWAAEQAKTREQNQIIREKQQNARPSP